MSQKRVEFQPESRINGSRWLLDYSSSSTATVYTNRSQVDRNGRDFAT